MPPTLNTHRKADVAASGVQRIGQFAVLVHTAIDVATRDAHTCELAWENAKRKETRSRKNCGQTLYFEDNTVTD